VTSRWLPYLRAGFLGAVVVFAYLGLRGRFGEVADALRETPPGGLVLALALVLLGLSCTGVLWLRIMAALGGRLPLLDGSATFFVGQLGKYIPGSVWSLGAQAQLAGRYAVPPRATVTAGLVFLGYHLVTGVAVGAVACVCGWVDAPWPGWVSVLALVLSVLALLPPVVRRLARRLGGRELQLGWVDTAVVVALMLATWSAYAAALVLLSPDRSWSDVLALGAAFAIAYAVGVVVIAAPAGVGAREALFVALLTPVLGVAEATALALLARVVHTVADGLLAASWWAVARRPGAAALDPARLSADATCADLPTASPPAGPR